jgi:hypothetical protein
MVTSLATRPHWPLRDAMRLMNAAQINLNCTGRGGERDRRFGIFMPIAGRFLRKNCTAEQALFIVVDERRCAN